MDRTEDRFGAGVEDFLRVSLQFLLAHPVVSCVIPGFRNTRQVELDLAPAGKPLSDDEVSWVREQFEALKMT